MKINVTSVGKGWKPDNAGPEFQPIYTLIIAGMEPQKTQDPKLAVAGEHEAESYTTKSGKTYWRSATTAAERTFKADPVKQESIEWQACLKAAVEAVNNYYSLAGRLPDSLKDYKKDIVEAVVTFTQTIEKKPDTIAEIHEAVHEPYEQIEDKGDYSQVTINDLPPVEVYDEIPY